MLSDSNRHKAHRPGKHCWSDKNKLDAVKLWLVIGNLAQTAASLSVPLQTMKDWRYSKWWEELVAEIRAENSLKLSNKLKAIAERALDETLDRLEKGDWIYDQKTGEMRRKPVNAREVNVIATGMLDRHLKLEEKPQVDENNLKTMDRLAALANAFTSFAKKTTKIEVIDVEVTDAIYDQRPQGLQERIELGKDESDTPGSGPGEENPSQERSGEDYGESTEFSPRGPQEGIDQGRFKLSEQSEGSVSQNQSS